jgi:hypothetical protein
MVGSRSIIVVLVLASLCACPFQQTEEPATTTSLLSDKQILIRASLDARGIRPSPTEFQKLFQDASQLDTMIDDFVNDARFAEQVKDVFAGAFRTRIDGYPFSEDPFSEGGVLAEYIGEEPLNLLAYIVLNDRPYSDIVLWDRTYVHQDLVGFWPMDEVEDEGNLPANTVSARYNDTRPLAGILSMNSMWWRHTSTVENANRGRTNALSKALLCQNWLDRAIDFPRDIDLTDTESIHNAIRENQGCTACHSTMDPIASYLWGFMYGDESLNNMVRYHPEKERMWSTTTLRPPGFFGEPGHTLNDLGRQFAADPRFVTCAVKRLYEGFLGRAATLSDDGALWEHREVFIASGLNMKALARSILKDPAYRGVARVSTYKGKPDPVELKLLTPRRLDSVLSHLTGFRPVWEERNLLHYDFGLRTIAGGSDKNPSQSPSTGLVLVQRRLAEAAARTLIYEDTEGAISDILRNADIEGRPSPDTLVTLLSMIISVETQPTGDEVAALVALYDRLHRLNNNPEEAWIGVITAILADPELLLY